MGGDVVALLPEAILVAGALVVLLAGSYTPRRRQWRLRLLSGVVAAGSGAAGVVGLVSPARSAFSATFAADAGTGAARVAVALSLLLVLAVAGPDLRDHPRESDTCALLLLGGAGTELLAGSADLALLVVGFLLASIPLYGLVGLVERRDAAEATMKTYLVGALSGVWLMLGVGLLFGLAGQTAYGALAGLSSAPVLAVGAGVLLVLVGLMFEVGGVPAHAWVPDAAQGASTTVAAYLTTVPKLGAVVAVGRLLLALPGDQAWWVLAGVLAVVSMSVGNLAAYPQTSVRRLLGWSTVSQAGYLLAAAAVVARPGGGGQALLYFLPAYAVTNLAAFAVVAATPDRPRLDDWRGAARTVPTAVVVLVVALLGLVGTPPTTVFVAKLLTIAATWDAGGWWLALAVVVNTVVSLFYYLRWLAPAILVARPAVVPGETPAPGAALRGPLAVAVVAAGLTLALGLAAGPVLALLG